MAVNFSISISLDGYLGGGTRLLDDLSPGEFEVTRVVDSPKVTHLGYRVATP